MNYKKIYRNLYLKTKDRDKSFKEQNECVEKHHFIPRSIWDKEENIDVKNDLKELLNIDERDGSNLVYLTCREHFIAHLLLWKIYKENVSILYAIFCFMSLNNKNIVNSILYEKIKINNIKKNIITVFSKNDNKYKNILSDELYKNRDLYETLLENKIIVYNKVSKKNEVILKDDFNDNYIHINNYLVSCYDLRDNKYKKIKREDFEKYDYYVGNSYKKISVFSKELNKNVLISTDEYHKNKDKYIHNTEGKVVVIDLRTNENKLVLKEDFEKI